MRIHLAVPMFAALACGCAKPVVEVGTPPPTAVVIVADTLHGQVVEDPYRWLEEQDSPQTRAWIDARNTHTDAVFAQLPHREQLTALMTSLMKIDQIDTPTEKGGRYFFSRRRAEDELSILYYREGYAGADHVILDPHGMSEDHTTSVAFWDISDDGKLVIYGIREGGADQVSLHIRDIDAGATCPRSFPRTAMAKPSSRRTGEGSTTG